MEGQIKHFVAYHNTEKMGRPLQEGDPLRVLTNKPVTGLVGNIVWFITGEGGRNKNYALGSVFQVTEAGKTEEPHFKNYAAGRGLLCHPPVPLNDEPWFPAFLRRMSNFSLGLREVTEDDIAPLAALANAVGYISKKSNGRK